MGIIDFFKDTLGITPDADDIKAEIVKLGLNVQNFNVVIADGVATVTGLAVNRAEASKIVMAVGNNKGITKVDNQMRVPLSSLPVPPPAAAPTDDDRRRSMRKPWCSTRWKRAKRCPASPSGFTVTPTSI